MRSKAFDVLRLDALCCIHGKMRLVGADGERRGRALALMHELVAPAPSLGHLLVLTAVFFNSVDGLSDISFSSHNIAHTCQHHNSICTPKHLHLKIAPGTADPAAMTGDASAIHAQALLDAFNASLVSNDAEQVAAFFFSGETSSLSQVTCAPSSFPTSSLLLFYE